MILWDSPLPVKTARFWADGLPADLYRYRHGLRGYRTVRRRFQRLAAAFKTEAAAQGISQQTIQTGLAGVTPDPTIIARDHAQGVFKQSFEQFSGRMVPPRLTRGQKQDHPIRLDAEPDRRSIRCGRSDRRHLGLETDFGSGNGNFQTIRSLATLANDCRRPDKFRPELLRRSRSSIAAIWRQPRCAAPGPARSDRRNSCRRRI